MFFNQGTFNVEDSLIPFTRVECTYFLITCSLKAAPVNFVYKMLSLSLVTMLNYFLIFPHSAQFGEMFLTITK